MRSWSVPTRNETWQLPAPISGKKNQTGKAKPLQNKGESTLSRVEESNRQVPVCLCGRGHMQGTTEKDKLSSNDADTRPAARHLTPCYNRPDP